MTEYRINKLSSANLTLEVRKDQKHQASNNS